MSFIYGSGQDTARRINQFAKEQLQRGKQLEQDDDPYDGAGFLQTSSLDHLRPWRNDVAFAYEEKLEIACAVHSHPSLDVATVAGVQKRFGATRRNLFFRLLQFVCRQITQEWLAIPVKSRVAEVVVSVTARGGILYRGGDLPSGLTLTLSSNGVSADRHYTSKEANLLFGGVLYGVERTPTLLVKRASLLGGNGGSGGSGGSKVGQILPADFFAPFLPDPVTVSLISKEVGEGAKSWYQLMMPGAENPRLQFLQSPLERPKKLWPDIQWRRLADQEGFAMVRKRLPAFPASRLLTLRSVSLNILVYLEFIPVDQLVGQSPLQWKRLTGNAPLDDEFAENMMTGLYTLYEEAAKDVQVANHLAEGLQGLQEIRRLAAMFYLVGTKALSAEDALDPLLATFIMDNLPLLRCTPRLVRATLRAVQRGGRSVSLGRGPLTPDRIVAALQRGLPDFSYDQFEKEWDAVLSSPSSYQ